MNFSFIVLHFKAIESTERCIDSILKLKCDNHKFNIIVVDNGSCDGSAEKLCSRYKDSIHMIELDEGIGFSRANNKGYEYALKSYAPDYIVMTNNDIVFNQSDFMDKIVEINKNNDFDVLGPDIINPDGSHGNPYSDKPADIKATKRYINRARIKRFLGIIHLAMVDIRAGIKQPSKAVIDTAPPKEAKNVCIWGACIVFSKKFTGSNAKAFYPETMFYCEENILCHRVIKSGGLILYSPDIRVYHGHSDSTRAAFKNRLKRSKFCFTNDIKSGKIYLNMLLKEKEDK